MCTLRRAALCVAVSLGAFCGTLGSQQGGVSASSTGKREDLTNLAVAQMVRDGVPQDAIIAKIAASEPHFDLSEQGLAALRDFGVSDDIVRAMLARRQRPSTQQIQKSDQVPQPQVPPPPMPPQPASGKPGDIVIIGEETQPQGQPNPLRNVGPSPQSGRTEPPSGLPAAARPIGGPVAAEPPRPDGAASLRLNVRAALVDKELNVKPIPRLALRLYRTADPGSSTEIRTALDGTVSVELPPAAYRIESVRPLSYQGKAYSWRVDLVLSRDDQRCELTNDNAVIVNAPGGAASSSDRSRDNLTDLFQKYRDGIVTVWSEIGTGTGFIFDQNGLILTNQHVIGASDYVAVQFDEKRKIRARALASDAERDIAVLIADTDAFPGSVATPLWERNGSDPSVVEGERVLTIGSPLSQRKIMTTGVVSKVEKGVIIADLNINHGNSGGPLFNSLGQVVGLTTFREGGSGPGIAGIVRIEEAYPLIAQARARLLTEHAPSKALLLVEPTERYPLQALKQAVQSKKRRDTKRYFFSAGDFEVAVLTPPLKYTMMMGTDVAAAKELNKRLKKASTEPSLNPLDELHNWGEYVGQYDAVIHIRVYSRLHETFWSGLSRSMAAAGGTYGGPARMKFKNDFGRMRLLCDGKEIDPIHPGKIAHVISVSNYIVQVSDASYEGLYTYLPDAISPACHTTFLEIESVTKPGKPVQVELDRKMVQRVWDDFAPYRDSAAKPNNSP
jgi:S1-C subfamily serine protease